MNKAMEIRSTQVLENSMCFRKIKTLDTKCGERETDKDKSFLE